MGWVDGGIFAFALRHRTNTAVLKANYHDNSRKAPDTMDTSDTPAPN